MQGADLNVSERYSNFHTIDWLRDLTKDRLRHRWILKEKAKGHLFEKIQAVFDACSGWFCVLLIGIAAGNITMQLRAHTKTKVTQKIVCVCIAGIVAGIVDIGSSFASSLRSGFCLQAFWLNIEQCCWHSKNLTFDDYGNGFCDEVVT